MYFVWEKQSKIKMEHRLLQAVDEQILIYPNSTSFLFQMH